MMSGGIRIMLESKVVVGHLATLPLISSYILAVDVHVR